MDFPITGTRPPGPHNFTGQQRLSSSSVQQQGYYHPPQPQSFHHQQPSAHITSPLSPPHHFASSELNDSKVFNDAYT